MDAVGDALAVRPFRSGRRVFGFAFLIGLLLAAAAIVALLQLRSQMLVAFQTLGAIGTLQSSRAHALADVIDAETGYRGFQYSHRVEALEPLDRGMNALSVDLGPLLQGGELLRGGDFDHLRPQIESYSSAANSAMADIKLAVAARRAAADTPELEVKRMLAVKQEVDEARRISDKLDSALRQIVEDRRNSLQSDISHIVFVIAALIIGLALVSFTQGRELLVLGRRLFSAHEDSQERIATLSHTLLESREALDALNRRLVLAMRSAHVVVFSIERFGRITWMNDAGSGMFGNTALPFLLADFAPPQDRERVQQQIAGAVPSQELVDFEMRLDSTDLNYRWLKITLAPMHMEDGAGFLGSAVDVTNIKRREEGNNLLMRELSHRSKNLLAIVQAMARQTAKATPSPLEFYERFGARLRALAAGHDLLVKASYAGADLGDLLRSQIGPLEALIGSRIFVQGPALRLRPEAAQNLGMAFHELATNANIHGALTSPLGLIDIRWRVEEAGSEAQLILDWVESNGPGAVASERRGFGSTLITQNLPRSLHGAVTLDHLAEGTRCHMELPIKYIVETYDETDEAEDEAQAPVRSHGG